MRERYAFDRPELVSHISLIDTTDRKCTRADLCEDIPFPCFYIAWKTGTNESQWLILDGKTKMGGELRPYVVLLPPNWFPQLLQVTLRSFLAQDQYYVLVINATKFLLQLANDSFLGEMKSNDANEKIKETMQQGTRETRKDVTAGSKWILMSYFHYDTPWHRNVVILDLERDLLVSCTVVDFGARE